MFNSDMLKLDQECFCELWRLLDKYSPQLCKNAATERHKKMVLPASAYTSGITVGVLEKTGDGDAGAFESSHLQLLKKLEAVELFYASRQSRFDTVSVVKEALNTAQEIGNV